jgi:transglutaminase-like putative cysteine protease
MKRDKPERRLHMTFEIALETCRSSELRGWALVEFAQRLVCRSMTYSTTNSLDSPLVAFEKGQGYCWHRASILNRILRELGFDSRLVHAYKNLFPESELCGVQV